MTNDRPNPDPHDHTLDGEIRNFPARFASREEWDAYNARLAAREASLEYRALHGILDTELPF
jgi:hypothetical protein